MKNGFYKRRSVILLLLATVLFLIGCGITAFADETDTPQEHTSYEEHTLSEWTMVNEATCTETGLMERHCTGCEYSETIIVPAHHVYDGNWIIDNEASCTEPGSEHRNCINCTEGVETQPIPATGHTFSDEWMIDEEASCTEPGSMHRKCLYCEETETQIIPAKDHSFSDEWTVDKTASCTENGEKSHHCSECEEKTDITVIPATGHLFPNVWTVDKEATCTEEGLKHRTCIYCEEETEYDIIPATGHHFSDEWTVDVEPTCEEYGEKSHHCSDCEARSEVSPIEPLGHEYECIFEESATCSKTGKKIFVCKHDSKHTYEEILPRLVHIESDWVIDAEPTYDCDGSRHKYCILCGETLRTEAISMLSDIAAPSGKIILENDVWTKLAEKINATHYKKSSVSITVEGNDNETGVKSIEYYVSSRIMAYSELFASAKWKSGTLVELSDEGSYVVYAKITDNSDNICYVSSDLIVIDKTMPEIVGLEDSGVYCISAQFEVTDSNLLYVKVNNVNIEPDKKGKYTVNAKSGFQQVEACDSANNITFIVILVNAEHEFKTLITDKNPTCLDGGAAHYECIHCKAAQYEMLDPYGHEEPQEWTVILQPTCEKQGKRIKLCARCGISLAEEDIPKLAHDYRNGKCVLCGKVYSKEIPTVAIVIGIIFALIAAGTVIFDRTIKTKNQKLISRALVRGSRRR